MAGREVIRIGMARIRTDTNGTGMEMLGPETRRRSIA